MNLPNYLTISRILLTLLCVMFILKDNLSSLAVAFLFFLAASFTDFLDGFIARKKYTVSDLGKLLDPIADKILILGVFLAFLATNIINIWIVIVIMLREFIITGVRLFALNQGYILAAKRFGKHKTFSQFVVVSYIFIVLILKKIYPSNFAIDLLYHRGISLSMWYIAAITVLSGAQYLWANRKIIKNF